MPSGPLSRLQHGIYKGQLICGVVGLLVGLLGRHAHLHILLARLLVGKRGLHSLPHVELLGSHAQLLGLLTRRLVGKFGLLRAAHIGLSQLRSLLEAA